MPDSWDKNCGDYHLFVVKANINGYTPVSIAQNNFVVAGKDPLSIDVNVPSGCGGTCVGTFNVLLSI